MLAFLAGFKFRAYGNEVMRKNFKIYIVRGNERRAHYFIYTRYAVFLPKTFCPTKCSGVRLLRISLENAQKATSVQDTRYSHCVNAHPANYPQVIHSVVHNRGGHLTQGMKHDRLRTSKQTRDDTMYIGVMIGEAISIGYGMYVVGLVSWSVAKMVNGLAVGLLKS
jgi:hypothetical protein